MKRFFQTCVAIAASTTPLFFSGWAANATPVLPTQTSHGAEALKPVVPSMSSESPQFTDLEVTDDSWIRARENFLLKRNCLQNKSKSLEVGIPLICQSRGLNPDISVGGPNLNLSDLPDREGLKLDLVLTHHRLEAGPSQGLGVRFKL